MIDPFSIISLISSYATGYKAVDTVFVWMNGRNIDHFQNGCEYLSKGIDSQNVDFLNKAIQEFDFINKKDDKLFILACSYLNRAICYAYLLNFTLSYDYLDKLDDIEYGLFTRKKDTIDEIKSSGRSFRQEVKKVEDAYNEYIRSLQEGHEEDKNESTVDWKKLFIGLLITIIIGAIVLLFSIFL